MNLRAPIQPGDRNRRGVTLVEMLVVIAIGTVVMSAVVSGSATLLSVDRRVQNRADETAQLDQLVGRLRADLHGAEQARFDSEADELLLTRADGDEVGYAFEPGGCVRRSATGALPLRLPPNLRVRCETDTAAAPDVLELALEIDDHRTLPIAARLGADRRLLTPGASP